MDFLCAEACLNPENAVYDINLRFIRNRWPEVKRDVPLGAIEKRHGEESRSQHHSRLHRKCGQHRFCRLQVLLEFYHFYLITATTTRILGMHTAFGTGLFLDCTQLHTIHPAHTIMRAHHKAGAHEQVGDQ